MTQFITFWLPWLEGFVAGVLATLLTLSLTVFWRDNDEK